MHINRWKSLSQSRRAFFQQRLKGNARLLYAALLSFPPSTKDAVVVLAKVHRQWGLVIWVISLIMESTQDPSPQQWDHPKVPLMDFFLKKKKKSW